MKKQDIQTLVKKLNIELDEIQRVKFENNSVLSLILNNNFDRVLYLDALKKELIHLLGYFDRNETDELTQDNLKDERQATTECLKGLVEDVTYKELNKIRIQDIQEVKAIKKYIEILDGELEF